jgi:hypothetical protein
MIQIRATVKTESIYTLQMDEETVQHLRALLTVALSWVGQPWARALSDVLDEVSDSDPIDADIGSRVHNAVHTHVMGAHNMQHVCDDDYFCHDSKPLQQQIDELEEDDGVEEGEQSDWGDDE